MGRRVSVPTYLPGGLARVHRTAGLSEVPAAPEGETGGDASTRFLDRREIRMGLALSGAVSAAHALRLARERAEAGGSRLVVGVTGSRWGADPGQLRVLGVILALARELHHGDCTGWDEAAAILATDLGVETVSHPPENPAFRAFHQSNVIWPERGYHDRNDDILRNVHLLVAAPDERVNSGTWSTVRKALARDLPTIVALRA